MSRKPPDPDNLLRHVSRSDKSRIAAWNRWAEKDTPGSGQVINPYEYAEMVTKTGIGSPMSAIPVAARSAEFSSPLHEVIPYFGYSIGDLNAPVFEDYDDTDGGYGFDNRAPFYHLDQDPRWARADEAPAPITIVPTSTTNPDRPRTVAAGYDFAERKLTVIFRDGTYYNYFNVENTEWQNFKRAKSKGRYIKAHLDVKPRGVADQATIPQQYREATYQFARTGQDRRGGVQPGHKAGGRRGTGYASGNLGGTGRARLKKSLGQHGGSGVSTPKKP